MVYNNRQASVLASFLHEEVTLLFSFDCMKCDNIFSTKLEGMLNDGVNNLPQILELVVQVQYICSLGKPSPFYSTQQCVERTVI